MKNFLKSRGFLVAVLTIACIGIIAACWYVSRDQTPDFQPEETEATADSQEWQESENTVSGKETEENGASAYAPPAGFGAAETLEEYPKVESESEDEVVIDFTPAEKPEETPPEPPEGKTVMEDPGPEHPVNTVPEETVPEPETETDKGPAAGSTNENGAIYDPVFGWVVPGQVSQSTMDSDGDPNKMVGNMGN